MSIQVEYNQQSNSYVVREKQTETVIANVPLAYLNKNKEDNPVTAGQLGFAFYEILENEDLKTLSSLDRRILSDRAYNRLEINEPSANRTRPLEYA